MIKNLKMNLNKTNKSLLFAFAIFIGAFIVLKLSSTEQKIITREKIFADTMIPKGLVLVPIELANVETISALIDQFGVVDLYAGTPTARGSTKIATKVKIMKAPLNPQQYAVLVPENLSSEIMRSVGPFWAVVQNREVHFEQKAEVPKPVSIEYYKGGS